MKHMKNFTLFGAALLIALTLVGCGKNKNTPEVEQEQNSQTQSSDVNPTKPSLSEGEKKWPTADFITEEMKYTGKGNIVHTEHIDGKEDGDMDQSWTVFYKDAELNDVKTYINSLKNSGFKYTEENEPTIEFKDGMFAWEGKTADEKHFVYICMLDHNSLTSAGETNIEQNMYIRLSNYDLKSKIEAEFPDDLPIEQIQENK